MLPRENRLKRTKDFARVRRHGRSAGGSLAALYVLPSRTAELQIGFSVSKRVGQATIRNLVKRRLREAVRVHLTRLRPGQHLVFIARPAAASASYVQIAAAVTQLLQRTGATERS